MKNCPSFKQKSEKQLGPAVQEQLPVEANAWPRAKRCGPAVKVSLCSSTRPLLLWAVSKREGSSMRGKHRCEEESERHPVLRRDRLEPQRMRGLSTNSSSAVSQLNLRIHFQQPSWATYHSIQSLSFLRVRETHSRKVGAFCPSKGCSRPSPPILAAAGFSSCPVSAESSHSTLVPCHVLRGRSCQSLSAYVSALQTGSKENFSW